MDPSLKKFLDQFLNFRIGGKKVDMPYWMNDLKRGIYGPYGGKGTPEEIRAATLEAVKEENLDLKELSDKEIYQLMKKKHIGLDCSGFAYQILNFLDLQKGGDGLENSVEGVNGRGIKKTNADALTNDINSIPVRSLREVKVGDLIRIHGGKHVAVIVDISDQEITFAHSSHKTKEDGPHLSRIKIVDSEKGIECQVWEEKTLDGREYCSAFLNPNNKDGLRRLKILL